jgi:hypothetical protein
MLQSLPQLLNERLEPLIGCPVGHTGGEPLRSFDLAL